MDESTEPATQSSKPSKTGASRLIAATRHSINGLIAAFKREEAFRLEIIAFLILTPIAFWIGETSIEKVLLVGSLVLVLLIELINTAIEAIVDRFGGELHELSRVAKDVGSAAVGISLLLVFFTWGMLLL